MSVLLTQHLEPNVCLEKINQEPLVSKMGFSAALVTSATIDHHEMCGRSLEGWRPGGVYKRKCK